MEEVIESFDRHHYIIRVDGSSSPAGNYLKFNIDDGSGNGGETFSDTMILRGDGNVGIGTDNPGQKLQVNGTIYQLLVMVVMDYI